MVINAAADAMKELCKLAGMGGKGCANHALRACMIAALDGEGCSSEAIAQRSGRRSSSGAQQRMRSALEAEILQQKRLAGGKALRDEKAARSDVDAIKMGWKRWKRLRKRLRKMIAPIS